MAQSFGHMPRAVVQDYANWAETHCGVKRAHVSDKGNSIVVTYGIRDECGDYGFESAVVLSHGALRELLGY